MCTPGSTHVLSLSLCVCVDGYTSTHARARYNGEHDPLSIQAVTLNLEFERNLARYQDALSAPPPKRKASPGGGKKEGAVPGAASQSQAVKESGNSSKRKKRRKA